MVTTKELGTYQPVDAYGIIVWLLIVATKELGTYQPVDVLSMGDGVLGALVMTG
jgi:hypothetical protein